jgi:hypothetical protein
VAQQSVGQRNAIRQATDIEFGRRPRAFARVEGVDLAHAAFDVHEQHLPRRRHRRHAPLREDVDRRELLQEPADEGHPADAQQLASGKSRRVSCALHMRAFNS